MDTILFDELYEKVRPVIEKKNTNMRDAISAHERLCVTLQFLASGSSYGDLMYSFRISTSAISKIIPEVCEAIYDVLKDEYLKPPSTRNEWKHYADQFEMKWQFPRAVGAIDGKHVNIRAPPNSGSEYFNYKKHFSLVLLAIADANAKIIAFDLGSPGSQSDGGIFKDGKLKDTCKSDIFPPASELHNCGISLPYFLLGDDAFALDVNLMKPYPHRSAMGDEKIFNYRLSRARRIVENAFGLLCAKFRVLLKTLELGVSNAMQVVRACLALHNFLVTRKDQFYSPPGFLDTEDDTGNVIPGKWRDNIDGDVCTLRPDPSTRPSTARARDVRDNLKEYFCGEGAVSFQWAMTD